MAQPGCFATLLMLFASLFGLMTAFNDPAEEAIFIKEIYLPQGTAIYDDPAGNVTNSTPEGLFWSAIGTDESRQWVYGFYILDNKLALEGWVEATSENLPVIEDLSLLRARALSELIPTENRNVDN
jgi:hypothetical protein